MISMRLLAVITLLPILVSGKAVEMTKINGRSNADNASIAQPKVTQVAFSAHRTTPQSAPTTPHAVSYDQVLLNIGGGLAPTDGVFTAPTIGTYMFTFHAFSLKGATSYVDLFYGNGIRGVTAHGNVDEHVDSSNSIILNLNIGDKVWLELRQGSQIFSDSTQIFTTFTGHML